MLTSLQFLFSTDPFVEAIAKVQRMRVLVIRLEYDLQHNKGVKDRISALKRVIGIPHASNNHCFLKLTHKKQQKVALLPECDGKNHLKHTLSEELHLVKMLIHALGISVKDKRELFYKFKKMRDIVEKLRARVNHDRKMYQYVIQTTQKKK